MWATGRSFTQMRVRTLQLILVAAVLSISAPALAQTTSADEARKDARIHAGPFYLTPAFELRELGVDTNVFNEAEEPKSDFTFTLSPRIVAAIPVQRRALVRADAVVDILYFQKYATQRSVSPAVAVLGELYLNHLTLFAKPSYRRARQRPNDEIDTRTLWQEHTIDGGIRLDASSKLSFELAGARHATEYGAGEIYYGTSLQTVLNHDSNSVRLTPRWQLTPLTSLAMSGEVVQDRFLHSPTRDSDSVIGTIGLELRPRALVSGSGFVGVRRFRNVGGFAPEYKGLVARAGLATALQGATTLLFDADRDVQYSFEPTQPYYVRTGLNLSVRRHLVSRYDVMAGAGRHRSDYRELLPAGTATGSSDTPRTDITRTYALSLGYRVGRDGRLALGATYWRRESSTHRLPDYDGLRIGTSLTYGF